MSDGRLGLEDIRTAIPVLVLRIIRFTPCAMLLLLVVALLPYRKFRMGSERPLVRHSVTARCTDELQLHWVASSPCQIGLVLMDASGEAARRFNEGANEHEVDKQSVRVLSVGYCGEFRICTAARLCAIQHPGSSRERNCRP